MASVLIVSSWMPARLSWIVSAIGSAGDEIVDVEPADWLISCGCDYILKQDTLDRFGGRTVNLHPSFLPWNRGQHPNLWSWYDNTPKGVSLHRMDAGIDTGPIYAQVPVFMDDDETLRTSYRKLSDALQELFCAEWRNIRSGSEVFHQKKSASKGNTLRSSMELLASLPLRYDTPTSYISAMYNSRNG